MSPRIDANAIERGTGRPWSEWLEFFDAIGASALTHSEIVERTSELGAPPWWRQMVVVAYEQHIGRRQVGQRAEGTFSVSANRTLDATLDSALDRWLAAVAACDEHDGVGVAAPPETSATERWRYWRCALVDDSRVTAMISAKSGTKVTISVQHERLESADTAERWRTYWKGILATV
jgi:hypothetical protein